MPGPRARSNSNSGNAKRTRTNAPRTSTRSQATTKYVPRALPAPVDFGRNALPLRVKNVMRYSVAQDVTINAGGTALAGFRANGLYDPEIALGGHQPFYFDQLTALYNHWTVVKSRMKCRVTSKGITTSGKCMVTQLIDDDGTVTTTSPAVRERIGAKNRLITPADTDKGAMSYFNAQAAFGGNVIDNTELQGDAASDPTEQQSFFVYLTEGSETDVFTIFVELEYDVIWSELKSVTGS